MYVYYPLNSRKNDKLSQECPDLSEQQDRIEKCNSSDKPIYL